MHAGLVSIVMPIFNGERYLSEAIQSVLGQDYADWELLAVDDGSTDSSAEIVCGFRDDRIRLIQQENRGQAAALNTGLDHASGEYYTTLDADDCYTEDGLAARVERLAAAPRTAAVYGDGYYCERPGVTIKHFRDVLSERPSGDVFGALAASPFFGTGANVLIRRAVLEREAIRYDESILWCQDHDLLLRLAATAPFERVDTPTVWYRQHGESMTSRTGGKRLASVLRMKRKVMASPSFEKAAVRHRQSFFYDLLIVDLEGDNDGRAGVLAHSSFQAMPARNRALLLRLAAAQALLQPGGEAPARAWLRRSVAANPLDPKTLALLTIAAVHPGAAARAVQGRRSRSSLAVG